MTDRSDLRTRRVHRAPSVARGWYEALIALVLVLAVLAAVWLFYLPDAG